MAEQAVEPKKIVTGKKQIAGFPFATVKVLVKDGDKTVEGFYDIPETKEAFKGWVATLTEAALETAWERYNYATDLKARAAVREGTAVTIPVIATKKYGKLNLVTGEAELNGPVALENRIKMLNGAIAYAASKDETAPKAILKAREELLAGKQVREQNGMLVKA